jgi:hypothetical protein
VQDAALGVLGKKVGADEIRDAVEKGHRCLL